jgi:hypothetical protein
LITIAAQYLEDSPQLAQLSPQAVRDHLREAAQRLPLARLMLGWHLPQPIMDAVADEARRLEICLYRWHPLLSGDGVFLPRPEWQTLGLDGSLVEGFRGLPEFTFVCPNKIPVQEAVMVHLAETLKPPYQGVFFDRIRFPSPAGSPISHLACFCADCCRAAQETLGFDLEAFQRSLFAYLADKEAPRLLAGSLLGEISPEMPAALSQGLRRFFRFRCHSITGLVGQAVELAHSRGMKVGLDCFSPILTHMVGQDLSALALKSDWIKVMVYAHALGPAGLPYELHGLASFLRDHAGLAEGEALAFLERRLGFEMPASFLSLQERGLSSPALVTEIERAKRQGVRRLLAGLELVEISGACTLQADQIQQDWQAVLRAGPEGLVLSWDLWHIPLERLELVSKILPG